MLLIFSRPLYHPMELTEVKKRPSELEFQHSNVWYGEVIYESLYLLDLSVIVASKNNVSRLLQCNLLLF